MNFKGAGWDKKNFGHFETKKKFETSSKHFSALCLKILVGLFFCDFFEFFCFFVFLQGPVDVVKEKGLCPKR